MSGYDSESSNPIGATPGSGANPTGNPYGAATGQSMPEGGTYSGSYNESAAYPPPYGTPGYPPAPPAAGLPNPGLAVLLGFIPGVGAMYNGQFAKGLAHIVIFAVLVSLSDHVNGIFGLLVAGWVFYMVFDSYQTARARREGLQPPDPFGLNTIGERLGLGNGPNWSDFTAKPTAAQSAQSSGYSAPAGSQAYAAAQPATPYAAAAGAPAYSQGYASGAAVPPVPPYGATPYGPPPVAPYGAYAAPYAQPLPTPPSWSDLPVGAFWLIGFGVLALVGTLSHRFSWSGHYLDGLIVIAVGVAMLVTRVLRARSVYPAGTAASAWYLLRSSRIGLFLVAVGVALTLNNAGVLTWNYLWPYLLIFIGVFLLLERAAHNRMLAAEPVSAIGVPVAEPFAPGGPSYSAATPSSSFVPSSTNSRDEEGR